MVLKLEQILTEICNLYFRPKSFEKSGKIYEALGIRQFKKFVPNGDYMNSFVRKINPPHKIIRDKSTARIWETFTRIYEGIHIGFASLMLSCMINGLADSNYNCAIINAALNTTINIYPIMLQRYNRARIYNFLEK